jgi:xylulokinase
VNTFAHVNHTSEQQRLGVLLCINGTGILNRWIKNSFVTTSYDQMNRDAAQIPAGSGGIQILPFGNGAERILENKLVGAHFHNIDLNVHTPAHIFRAAQEGIAFAFRYGLDIMRASGMRPSVIRAGQANMFLSKVFTEAFVNATQVPVELYNSDGSVGAALGAGIGAGIFASEKEAFANARPLQLVEPGDTALYNDLYERWKGMLERVAAHPADV